VTVITGAVAFLGFPAALMLTGALLGAGTSVAIQKLTTGHVDWTQTALHSGIAVAIFALAYGLHILPATATTPFWNWLLYWRDRGGRTDYQRLPGGWWPKYEATVHNFDKPGTLAWRSTQVHENLHALVAEHAGPVKWLADSQIGPVPMGAPVTYTLEVVGRVIGYAAVGRPHAMVLSPFDAFASLDLDQRVMTVVVGLAGLNIHQATRSKRPHDRLSDTSGDARGRTQDPLRDIPVSRRTAHYFAPDGRE